LKRCAIQPRGAGETIHEIGAFRDCQPARLSRGLQIPGRSLQIAERALSRAPLSPKMTGPAVGYVQIGANPPLEFASSTATRRADRPPTTMSGRRLR
jgi:hypothetical protein